MTFLSSSLRNQTTVKLAAVALLLIVSCCNRAPSRTKVLYDYETESDLERVVWRCHTLYSLSREHVSHGARCLKLELYPARYRGLTQKLGRSNWKGYKSLCFDVHNTRDEPVPLTIRIDDKSPPPDYADRFNRQVELKPGDNAVSIPLDALETSGTKRKLDVRRIERMLLYVGRPEDKIILYFDYMRLTT